MNKKIAVIIVIILQCLVLAYICIEREIILKTGDTVYIRTVPVDPRDLFRGDYVRLNYEISSIPLSMVDKEDLDILKKPEKKAYLIYREGPEKIIIPEKLVLKRPVNKKFIKGYTTINWRNNFFSMRYGIEKYFIQQGKGLAIEQGRIMEGIRIPLEMKVLTDRKTGTAALCGYRYSKIGMGIILPVPSGHENVNRFILKVRLVNAFDLPLAIVDDERHSTFHFEFFSQYADNKPGIRFKILATEPEKYTENDIRIIQPGAFYEIVLDLDSSGYELIKGLNEITWGKMEWNDQVRITYITPMAQKTKGLKNTDLLWNGRISSRAFSGRNFTD